MTAAQRAVRVSKLEAHHVTALNTLTSQPQSLAQIAAAYGVSQDAAEKHLSILIDEGLCTPHQGQPQHRDLLRGVTEPSPPAR